MGNVMGPLPLFSLLSDIHTAGASESPSFPQTAHLAIPRKMENSSGTEYTDRKQFLKHRTYRICLHSHQSAQQFYLHKAGDAYEVSERHYLSLQRTHGDNVLALLIKHNTVDTWTDNTHVGYLQSSRILWHKGSWEGRAKKRPEQKSTAR